MYNRVRVSKEVDNMTPINVVHGKRGPNSMPYH